MKRIEQTQIMLNLKKEFQKLDENKKITAKAFKKLYGFNVRKFANVDSVETIIIETKIKARSCSDRLTIENGTYKILKNNEWIKITLDNVKKYAIYHSDFEQYEWKKDFTARLQVKKYYYNYRDIINGLNYAIAKNILKEQKKIYSLENRKLRVCEYFDNQINELKKTIHKFQLEN